MRGQESGMGIAPGSFEVHTHINLFNLPVALEGALQGCKGN